MKPNLFTAIHNLVGGQLTGSSKGYNSFRYHDGQTPPTEEEANTKLAELQAEYDALQYQRDRIYPPIGDQLDEIYHNGIDEWKKTIKAVKDKHPKS